MGGWWTAGSDMTVVLGEKKLPAHKLLLCAGSPLLSSMLLEGKTTVAKGNEAALDLK